MSDQMETLIAQTLKQLEAMKDKIDSQWELIDEQEASLERFRRFVRAEWRLRSWGRTYDHEQSSVQLRAIVKERGDALEAITEADMGANDE